MNAFLERSAEVLKEIIGHAPEEGCVVVVTHLQNIMQGSAWLRQGLPEIDAFEYEYRELNEIAPGTTLELKREWTGA